jgi:hypothetical protein
MATSNATPPDDPDAPNEPASAAFPAGDDTGSDDSGCDDTGSWPGSLVDRTMVAISGVIDPLIENARQLAAVQAERCRLLAELDRLGHDPHVIAGLRGDPVETGVTDPDTQAHGPAWDDEELAQRTLAAEVAGALRVHPATARAMIFDAARLLGELPGVHAALANGRISWGHVVKLQIATADAPSSVLPALEAVVLPTAERLTATQFGRVAARELDRLHPVPLQVRTELGAARRRVLLRPDVDGMAWLNAYLKADEAQASYDRLTRIAKSLNDADSDASCAEPGAAGVAGGLGRPGLAGAQDASHSGEQVLRTIDQRRADAYRDLLLDGETSGGLGRGIRGTVHVTVPVLTLLGRADDPGLLEGYGPIDPESARKIAGTATSWDRILTHPETGCVLSVGRASYTVPADMRRYLQLRDQTCQGIGCNRKASNSEIDHTQAWNTGGATSVDNLVHLCKGCHRLKHQTSFSTRQTPEGHLTWRSPGGKTYTRQPAHPFGLPAPALRPVPAPLKPETQPGGPITSASGASAPPPDANEHPPF